MSFGFFMRTMKRCAANLTIKEMTNLFMQNIIFTWVPQKERILKEQVPNILLTILQKKSLFLAMIVERVNKSE